MDESPNANGPCICLYFSRTNELMDNSINKNSQNSFKFNTKQTMGNNQVKENNNNNNNKNKEENCRCFAEVKNK